MRRQKTLCERIEERIAGRNDMVFLTREFADLGSDRQVQRALSKLVSDGKLIRIGLGVYGPTIISRLSGEPILAARGGFLGAVREALTKLGVKWEPTDAERAYNERRSTQIPVNPFTRVNGRCTRKFHYAGFDHEFERGPHWI